MQVDVTPGKMLAIVALTAALISGGWQAFVFVAEVKAQGKSIEVNEKAIEANQKAGEKRDETLERIVELLEHDQRERDQQKRIRKLCSEGRIEDERICASEDLE